MKRLFIVAVMAATLACEATSLSRDEISFTEVYPTSLWTQTIESFGPEIERFIPKAMDVVYFSEMIGERDAATYAVHGYRLKTFLYDYSAYTNANVIPPYLTNLIRDSTNEYQSLRGVRFGGKAASPTVGSWEQVETNDTLLLNWVSQKTTGAPLVSNIVFTPLTISPLKYNMSDAIVAITNLVAYDDNARICHIPVRANANNFPYSGTNSANFYIEYQSSTSETNYTESSDIIHTHEPPSYTYYTVGTAFVDKYYRENKSPLVENVFDNSLSVEYSYGDFFIDAFHTNRIYRYPSHSSINSSRVYLALVMNIDYTHRGETQSGSDETDSSIWSTNIVNRGVYGTIFKVVLEDVKDVFEVYSFLMNVNDNPFKQIASNFGISIKTSPPSSRYPVPNPPDVSNEDRHSWGATYDYEKVEIYVRDAILIYWIDPKTKYP